MAPAPSFLIPNITSAKNIGDVAMLEVLMDLILKANPRAEIYLQSSEPHTHAYPQAAAIKPTLYYWAVFEHPVALTRLTRMLRLACVLAGFYLQASWLVRLGSYRSRVLADLIDDYLQADSIIFVGGEYLRSKKGFSQSLNLVMNLFAFALAKRVKAKKIVAPISIGPFAHAWQKRLTAHIVRNMDVVAVREDISYALMQSEAIQNLIRSSDHALLVEPNATVTPSAPVCIGFTIRDWLHPNEQANLEQAYAQALARIAKESGARIAPIVQVDAPQFSEGDSAPTARVVERLKQWGVSPLPTVHIKDVAHAKQVYGRLSVLVGMRMHSNILAAIQGVPFVAVSYEYKTQGIARDVGLAHYCLPCTKITAETLTETVSKAYRNRSALAKIMNQKLERIKKRETKRWLKAVTL